MLPTTVSVIVAAGSGRRMGGVRKPFLELEGEPVLLRALRPFLAHPAVSEAVVVLSAGDAAAPPPWLRDPRIRIVAGGAERGDSVRAGLAAAPESAELVLIHDGARPFVSPALVERVWDAAREYGAALAALPVTDTLKRVDSEGRIVETVDRRELWRAQTPQGFRLAALRELCERARADGFAATDEAALCERYGVPVQVVEGAQENLKITHPADLAIAEALAAAPGHLGPPASLTIAELDSGP